MSEPCYEHVKVIKSSVRSDHLAIVAYNGETKLAVNKTSTKVIYRKRTPAQNAQFLSHASSHILNLTISSENVQIEFDRFYSTMISLLTQYFPERTISLTSREPSYVTPEIKYCCFIIKNWGFNN